MNASSRSWLVFSIGQVVFVKISFDKFKFFVDKPHRIYYDMKRNSNIGRYPYLVCFIFNDIGRMTDARRSL